MARYIASMAIPPSRTARQRPRKAAPWRRFAVLGVALAVPALALPLANFGGEEMGNAAHARAIASELPEENFPGSAFYFLEDAPDLVEEAEEVTLAEADLAPTAPTVAGARPLRVTGSDRDHARAQRCMTMALHYEASGESVSGKRAVAQVILNRVAHPAFPSTVCGVVFQGAERTTGCQFSFACDGAMARRIEAGFSGTEARIAREALAGAVYAPVGHATHFHTLGVRPYWAPSLTNVTTIGYHTFYRWPGAQGQAAAFTTRYAGGEPAPGTAAPASTREAPPSLATLPPVAAPVAAQPRDATRPPPAPAAEPNLPGAGQVREEYARSGQWLTDP